MTKAGDWAEEEFHLNFRPVSYAFPPSSNSRGTLAQTPRSFTWHQASICLVKVAEVGLVLLLLLRASRVPKTLPSPSDSRISSPTLLSWASTSETREEADPVTTVEEGSATHNPL